MVDWKSPTEIANDSAAFVKLMHALLGLYIWEWATSLTFDWQFLSGKRRFKWPMMFYFLGRYSLLFALMGIAIASNVTREVNCQALYTFNQCLGNAAIGFASINLSLRTMAVWSQAWYVVVPLVAVIMGHWSLLLHGILLKAAWVEGEGCVITETSNTLLAATFIYTMAFDFTVLTLTAYKLAYNQPGGQSRLVSLIFGDGLIFFIIAFLSNLLATTFMLMNLNAVMSIIANVPAAIASTIVACRAVRRLTNYTTQGAELFVSTQGSTLAFRSNGIGSRPAVNVKKPSDLSTSGVHVHMETFESPASVEYDADGKVIKGDNFDAEAQVISDEFKRPPY
ncbi:hypothetical protein PLICRDRAFT_42383 [Plicaturopsis crispa FD-325 SS-3]|nr:hypothetical protein PLICRDRAFT_42383 [Plicaturopsis crispa FD-325 SS-3]